MSSPAAAPDETSPRFGLLHRATLGMPVVLCTARATRSNAPGWIDRQSLAERPVGAETQQQSTQAIRSVRIRVVRVRLAVRPLLTVRAERDAVQPHADRYRPRRQARAQCGQRYSAVGRNREMRHDTITQRTSCGMQHGRRRERPGPSLRGTSGGKKSATTALPTCPCPSQSLSQTELMQ